jgi:hypothetical protein
MPDDLTKLDLVKLLDALGKQAPGVQIHIHGDMTVNVLSQLNDASTSVTHASTTVNIDYSFVETLNLSFDEKKEVRSAFEKFAGTLKSFKDGSEGLKELVADCLKYGPAAIIAIQQGAQLLQQLFPS